MKGQCRQSPKSGTINHKEIEGVSMLKKTVLIILAGVCLMTMLNAEAAEKKFETATFAGGCFWCMEPPFEKLDGVKDVVSGYTGGHSVNPTYQAVSAGTTGHAEAIQITYDPSKVNYAKLLDIFWRQIDPTDAGGTFVDRGSQYRSAIFYHSKNNAALLSSQRQIGKIREVFRSDRYGDRQGRGVLSGEEYHQDYYKKNPIRTNITASIPEETIYQKGLGRTVTRGRFSAISEVQFRISCRFHLVPDCSKARHSVPVRQSELSSCFAVVTSTGIRNDHGRLRASDRSELAERESNLFFYGPVRREYTPQKPDGDGQIQRARERRVSTCRLASPFLRICSSGCVGKLYMIPLRGVPSRPKAASCIVACRPAFGTAPVPNAGLI